MSILDMGLEDAKEPTVVAADTEYKVRIVGAPRVDIDKNGNPYMLPVMEIPGEASSKNFTKFLRIPNKSMDAKQLNSAKWNMRLFLECFGMDPNRPFEPEELAGKEGWAILGIEDNEQFGEGNYVKKFIAPK
jgi:hypothetical protein